MSKRQRVSSAAIEASYNGFQPVPIRVQDNSAVSGSKKANGANGKGKGKAGDLSSTVHYLWIRQHRAPKSTATSTSLQETLPPTRTLFVANLPVDTTERDVRLMFGTYGGIDRVEFKVGEIGRMGREGDPWWTVEDEEEEDSDDDSEEEDDEDSEEQEEKDDDAAMPDQMDSAEDTSDPTLTKRQRRRITRKQERADPEFAINALRKKAPLVVPLPPLNPRSSANGQGYLAPCSGCYVVYLDELSVSRCLQLAVGGKTSGVKTWERAAVSSKSSVEEEPTGLTYYRRLHTLLRPSLEIIKRHADTSIALFDWHANLSSERAKRGAVTDDDGFTLVVRGGKFGRTAGKGEKGVAVASRRFMLDSKKAAAAAVKKAVVVASAEERGVTGDDADMLDAREGLTRGKKRKSQQLEGFYKFQRDEQRRSHLANIRANFEADKAKVETLKAAKRFKPY